ncbi:hypothetical protein PR048_006837 [Dryococelus australis]|uniref:Uncharacterized protein n=1 Tax=Dryococelus australis TaxID=614101 RepID=A0ABQ9IC13_9NEOP|nr:hypothetical protein PR048_006837 [Dryococelus australis]
MWESCRTTPLVGEFSRDLPFSAALSFRHCSILTSITLIGSQDLDVKSRPNLFTSPYAIPRAARIRVVDMAYRWHDGTHSTDRLTAVASMTAGRQMSCGAPVCQFEASPAAPSLPICLHDNVMPTSQDVTRGGTAVPSLIKSLACLSEQGKSESFYTNLSSSYGTFSDDPGAGTPPGDVLARRHHVVMETNWEGRSSRRGFELAHWRPTRHLPSSSHAGNSSETVSRVGPIVPTVSHVHDPYLETAIQCEVNLGKVLISGTKERRKTGDPENPADQRRRPARFPHAKNPGVTRPGVEGGSPWWEASSLTAQPPWPLACLQKKLGAAVAERLACSPLTKANRAQSPAGSLPDFWHVGIVSDDAVFRRGFRDLPFSAALSFRHCSILTSITLIGSQGLGVVKRCAVASTKVLSTQSRTIRARIVNALLSRWQRIVTRRLTHEARNTMRRLGSEGEGDGAPRPSPPSRPRSRSRRRAAGND